MPVVRSEKILTRENGRRGRGPRGHTRRAILAGPIIGIRRIMLPAFFFLCIALGLVHRLAGSFRLVNQRHSLSGKLYGHTNDVNLHRLAPTTNELRYNQEFDNVIRKLEEMNTKLGELKEDLEEVRALKLLNSRLDQLEETEECTTNGHEEVVKALVSAGADVHFRDDDGWQPLFWAADHGSTAAVNALIDVGANVSHTDDDGWTAIMWSCDKGFTPCVVALLAAGSDPNHAAENGGLYPMVSCTYIHAYNTCHHLTSNVKPQRIHISHGLAS